MPLMASGIVSFALDALDRAPVERHLEFAPRGAAASAGGVALGEIALAPAVMRGIDGNAESRVAVRHRALDIIVDPRLVAAHIELEHARRVRRGLGDPFETGVADRAEHVRDAEFGRRLDHRLGAAGVKALQRPDRAQHDRQAQLASEHFDGWIDLADVTQNARPERDGVERHAVAPQRRLGLDAADDIVPIVLIEICRALATISCRFMNCAAVEAAGLHGGVFEDRYWLVHGMTRCWLRDHRLRQRQTIGRGKPVQRQQKPPDLLRFTAKFRRL